MSLAHRVAAAACVASGLLAPALVDLTPEVSAAPYPKYCVVHTFPNGQSTEVCVPYPL